MVGMVQTVVLKKLLEHQHNWFQITLVLAQLLNVGYALNTRVGYLQALKLELMLFERVLKGDVYSEEPHILINLILSYVHTLLILFLPLNALSYL